MHITKNFCDLFQKTEKRSSKNIKKRFLERNNNLGDKIVTQCLKKEGKVFVTGGLFHFMYAPLEIDNEAVDLLFEKLKQHEISYIVLLPDLFTYFKEMSSKSEYTVRGRDMWTSAKPLNEIIEMQEKIEILEKVEI